MKFGIGLLPNEPASDIVGLVGLAEDKGFDTAFIPDSQLLWRDAYVTLGLCAANTSKILMGTAVTTPFTRHPSVIASAISTVDELSNGRAFLGLGRGDSAVHTLGQQPVALYALAEAVKVCRDLTSGRSVNYAGLTIKSEWSRRKIPIYVAASGPRTLQLMGEIADGVLITTGVREEYVRYGIDNVRIGARRAGRDACEVLLVCWAGSSISSDGKTAREEVKPFAASPIKPPIIGENNIERLKGTYDYAKHMEWDSPQAKAELTNAYVDDFTIAGTANECLHKVETIARMGVDEIAVLCCSREKQYFIKTFGDTIISTF